MVQEAGDAVRKDEPLVELETDKVTLEVNAPEAGVLGEIAAKEGETVGVNALLGQITAGGAAAAPAAATPAAAPKAEAPKAAPPKAEAPAATSMPPAPAAAKMMAESGVAVDAGSGKRGQVLKEDVMAAIARGASAPAAAPPTATIARAPSAPDDASREERVKMTKLRQTIARRLKESQNTAAMLTTFNEVDMTEVMALRARYKDVFEKKHGTKLGFMGFFVKACVQALKELRASTARSTATTSLQELLSHRHRRRHGEGPRRAGRARRRHDVDRRRREDDRRFRQARREGTLRIDEMQGGTFTITNGGIYGSLMSTPILNAPQSGILGMHKIQERPMVVGGQVVVRPMMYLALSYDHRIVDGKEAVTFLVRVKESLEDPARLVMDL